MHNLFAQIPQSLDAELFEELVKGRAFTLERIVSRGQATPEGAWLDQDEDEWVVLLKGSAGVSIKGQQNSVTLRPGDYLHIPAHTKHRVDWTEAGVDTVWLAIHFQPPGLERSGI